MISYKTYTYPFSHVVVDNVLPMELYEEYLNVFKSLDIDKLEYEEFDNYGNIKTPGQVILQEHLPYNFYENITDFLNKNFKINLENFVWRGYPEYSRYSFIPHIDDAVRTYNRNNYCSGIVKGLIHFPLEDEIYENCGTFLYDSNKNNIKVKEIEFTKNRMFLFDTSGNAIHSTDFFNEFEYANLSNESYKEYYTSAKEINKKRFTFNFECKYIGDDNPLDIYNKINYGELTNFSIDIIKNSTYV